MNLPTVSIEMGRGGICGVAFTAEEWAPEHRQRFIDLLALVMSGPFLERFQGRIARRHELDALGAEVEARLRMLADRRWIVFDEDAGLWTAPPARLDA